MTDAPNPEPIKPKAKADPETLSLRSPPPRVGRPVLIGTAAVGLTGLSAIVLFALNPPSLRIETPPEMVAAERNFVSEELTKLAPTYDGVRATSKPTPNPASPFQPPASETTQAPQSEDATRTARLAGQAREAPVLFRLQSVVPRFGTTPNATSGQGQQAATDTPSRLTALQVAVADGANPSTNDQTRKLAFLSTTPDKDAINPYALQTPASPYQLMAGTIIAASLITGLESDLPGFVIAQVTENIFDGVSGRYLLIPQGSRLIGKYDSVIAFGENRAPLVWQRIILPDGSSVVLDNLPATDTAGYAGLSDKVDLHTWQLLEGIALSTVLGVGQMLAFGPGAGDSS
jgi:type IV secretion system protein TrbI